MRMAFVLGSILSVAACASAGGSTAPSSERELTTADADAVVRVSPGQVLVVRVAANASTGFSWTWDEAAAAGVLVQDGVPTMAGLDPQRVGSGGTQTWRFRAAKPGDGELRLDYRRPWETEQPPARTQRWRIEVR